MQAAFALVLAAVTGAVSTPAPIPSPVPMTPARAQIIDAIARGELHAGSTPGLAIGIVEDGLLVYSRGFGDADIKAKRRVRASTEFYTGDISEQFTAACILLLAQDKKLSLTDKVAHFLPEAAIGRDVSLQQLLAHTSGLPVLADVPGVSHDPAKPVRWEDVLRELGKMKLVSDPGSQYRRNSLDYALAALIVQRVAGVPLSVFMQTRIFEPLIMTSTFLAGDQGSADVAKGYERVAGHFQKLPPEDPSRLLGSADVISTVDDLAKWDIGMPLLLNVDSMRTMWSTLHTPGSALYGIGWVVDQRGGQTYVWRNGSVAGFHAMNALLPEQHVAVIVLSNANSTGESTTVSPERVAARTLDVIAPLPQAHFENTIVQRASEWLDRLANVNIDRTQLTPGFSQYLTDRVVIQADLRSEGPLQSIVPVENYQRDGDTVYVFDVRFRRGSMRYQFALAPDGKIDALLLQPVS